MPLTQAEFEDVVKATCPHCASGNTPRFRPETSEWTHNFIRETGPMRSFAHTFCLATGIRKVFADQQAASGNG